MKVLIIAALLAVASAAALEQAAGPTRADQAPGPSIADQAPGPEWVKIIAYYMLTLGTNTFWWWDMSLIILVTFQNDNFWVESILYPLYTLMNALPPSPHRSSSDIFLMALKSLH